MEQIRIHNYIERTRVLGPGVRYAVWFQGCKKHCKNCMSPLSRDLSAGTVVSVSDLTKKILSTDNIEGVTISGGEPFVQVSGLYELLKTIKKQSTLGIIVYTGFTISELKSWHDCKVDEILSKFIDILIDGEYIDKFNDGRSLVGSSNQIVHFFTERYLKDRVLYEKFSRNVEISIDNRQSFLVGIPSNNTLNDWKHVVGKL